MGAMAIRTEGLSKYYGSVRALEDLDLEVAEGEVVGYLGPNGAGKTTTIRMLMDIIVPDSGGVNFFGEPFKREHLKRRTHDRLHVFQQNVAAVCFDLAICITN